MAARIRNLIFCPHSEIRDANQHFQQFRTFE